MTAVQDSLLTQTAGSDSDFSGGAGGWEVAADMITAAGSEIPCLSEADLTLSFVCDPWFFWQIILLTSSSPLFRKS